MFASSLPSVLFAVDVSCLPLARDNCLAKRPLGNYLGNEKSECLNPSPQPTAD